MRTFPVLALGTILLTGVTGNVLFAQDQRQPTSAAPQTAAPAQSGHTPNPQRQAKGMAKKLGLTPDQESKLEPILADRDQQLQSARADTTLAPKEKHAKLLGINQDSDAKIESILTDAQKQQYEQMKQERKTAKQQGGASSSN